MVIEENVIHDIGRLSPGEQGCQPSTTNWQNHDHGIYHGVGDSIIVRNNLMYRNIHGWSYHRYSGPGATARGLYIVNNTFAVPNPDKQGQIVIAGVTNNLVIENNVFYQPNTTGIWFDAADGGIEPDSRRIRLVEHVVLDHQVVRNPRDDDLALFVGVRDGKGVVDDVQPPGGRARTAVPVIGPAMDVPVHQVVPDDDTVPHAVIDAVVVVLPVRGARLAALLPG